MPGATAVAAAPTPAGGDAPSAAGIKNMGDGLDKFVVGRFASTGARNTAIPSPVADQVCMVAGVMYQYDGTNSVWEFASPAGVIKTCTATGTTSTSATTAQTPAIAGWDGQTFTITSARLLRCTAGIAVQASLADTKVAVSVDINGSGRLRWGDVVPISGTTLEPSPSGRMFSLSAGTYTISATLSKAATATAATANIAAGATLQIEDCGPA